MHAVVAKLVASLAAGDEAAIRSCYDDDASSFGPLEWPCRGAQAIAAMNSELISRMDGPTLSATDGFSSPDGSRVAVRLVRRWGSTAALETRVLTVREGLIVEEFVGPNTFQQADLELNQWGLAPADTSHDPAPPILSAAVDDPGPAPSSVPERFVSAFGRRDADALLELYDPGFVLYSPIAWGLAGTDPLGPFVDQFHAGFPGIRLTLHDQFSNDDGTRIAFRFAMAFDNSGTFFGHPPTGRAGVHAEFHTLRLAAGRIVEQVVTDISYGIPALELTVWGRPYPTETPDPTAGPNGGGPALT